MHSDRRTQTVIVCSIILILAFSTLPMGFLVGQTRTYNFTNIVSNKAYEGTSLLQPPTVLEIGTEVSPTEYEQIAYSDDIHDIENTGFLRYLAEEGKSICNQQQDKPQKTYKNNHHFGFHQVWEGDQR